MPPLNKIRQIAISLPLVKASQVHTLHNIVKPLDIANLRISLTDVHEDIAQERLHFLLEEELDAGV